MMRILILANLILYAGISASQIPDPALVGYWHNWNDAKAPYVPFHEIDDRYQIIEVAFAVPASATDMTMVFQPEGISPAAFSDQIKSLQAKGKKVLVSIGGANAWIDLTEPSQQEAFTESLDVLLDTYGFDGLDLDVEHGPCISINGGSISEPGNMAQQHLIEAIQQIMAAYRVKHDRKMLLTLAPETAYVQGGQSAFGGIWGGYLPIIHALRDSLDLLQVQLYNSGSMYGIDGKVYVQGTADFIVAMTEAVIQGFPTAGGFFEGLSANKVAVALPACEMAAGGGFVEPAIVSEAINYLRGMGPQAGSYVLDKPEGYPDLRGMMTWSINWDAVPDCGGVYSFAANFQDIFGAPTSVTELPMSNSLELYPNPTQGTFTVALPSESAEIIVLDLHGKETIRLESSQHPATLQLDRPGFYVVYAKTATGIARRKLLVIH